MLISVATPYDRDVRIARAKNSSQFDDSDVSADDNAQNDKAKEKTIKNSGKIEGVSVSEAHDVPGQGENKTGHDLNSIANDDPINALLDEQSDKENHSTSNEIKCLDNAKNDDSTKNVDDPDGSQSFEKLNFADLFSSDEGDGNLSYGSAEERIVDKADGRSHAPAKPIGEQNIVPSQESNKSDEGKFGIHLFHVYH